MTEQHNWEKDALSFVLWSLPDEATRLKGFRAALVMVAPFLRLYKAA